MPASPALNIDDGDLTGVVRTAATTRSRATLSAAHGVFSDPLTPMLTAVAVAVLVILSITFARSPDHFVVLWLPNAVAVAMWLRSGRGQAFDLSFGALMATGIIIGQLMAGYGPTAAFAMGAVHTLEIVAAVLLARRFAPGQSLTSVKSTVRVGLATAIAAPVPAAIIAALVLMWLRDDVPFLQGFQTWWLSHALGMLIGLPLLLSVNRRSLLVIRRPWRILEWGVLLGAVAGLLYAIYFGNARHLSFLLDPLLVLVVVRLRMPGVMTAVAVVSIAVLASVLYLPVPAYRMGMPLGERIMIAQFMMLFTAMFFVLAASFLDERDQMSARARAGQKRAELTSEAKSRLLANVAHEIKSPVGGVIGIGELWASGQLGPVTATQKEMAEMLVKTARQIETLAHDLLDVARAESGAVKVELRPTDVAGILQDIRRATALRPEARAITLDVRCEGEGLVALADSQRLSQVIDNLATNAVKYGGQGGVVAFRAFRMEDRIRIEVSDRGPGLSPEKQNQLFEPFNRLGLERSAVEGHGIGLALAKRLVELQDGAIGVESVVGEGATFWVELPAA